MKLNIQLFGYTPSAGGKLEYADSVSGTYTKISGLKSIPAIGEEPNKISTTNLDNLIYETEVDGLMPAPKLNFEFDMEDPTADANINKAVALATAGTVKYWKLTYSNGIVHSFQSKVKIGYNEVGVDEIAGFTMYLTPIGEITTTVPSASTQSGN